MRSDDAVAHVRHMSPLPIGLLVDVVFVESPKGDSPRHDRRDASSSLPHLFQIGKRMNEFIPIMYVRAYLSCSRSGRRA
jgi:hypothetical protein